MYYLHFSFIDRGDQYASFKKMKSQKYFMISRNTVLQSPSYGPLGRIIYIYVPGYIWQRCWLLVTINTIMIFDTDGIRYDSSGQNDDVVCS